MQIRKVLAKINHRGTETQSLIFIFSVPLCLCGEISGIFRLNRKESFYLLPFTFFIKLQILKAVFWQFNVECRM